MKLASSFGLLIAVLFSAGASAAAATTSSLVGQAGAAQPADFGSPLSGEIPILYNDQHVYSKPDVLRRGRVLAALAKDGAIYVPLRSMFEQMGASVSYDPSSKIATISKPGAEIVVTVGKPEVVVNGETRPLDVPPMVYNGVVMVPIRVISEGMGAYVLWVPDRHIVVVRYVPPTPPPAPPPTAAPPQPTIVPAPVKTPNPLTLGGYFRSYYFTRQNATNNPGTQFNFSPGAKYNSNAVNQASWNSAIAVHGDYNFPGGWRVGGTYLYANPASGPCAIAINHAKNAPYPAPNCVQQVPPNTNPDDTLPGFALSTGYEAYLAYRAHGFNGAMGNILITTPWANPADTRLKPQAFEGGYLDYTAPSGWSVGGADMLAFEGRTSSTFSRNTLLTSYPAGSNGLPSNIIVSGGNGITTNGFTLGRVGYADPSGSGFSANGWFYNVSDLANMSWFDGKYTFRGRWAPYVAMQGGWETNSGQSYIGKIDSQVFGAQVGANITKNLVLSVGYDQIPWKTDTIFLPTGVTCNNSNHQVAANGATLAYFLPVNAGQCFTNPNGTTNIYYGGWASPYSDNTTSDPLYTTNFLQGQVDRRAPGSSWQAQLAFTSTNQKWIVLGADAWYDYGNAIAPQNTKIWWLDGRYRFSHVGKGPYHGLMLRYRYGERYQSNTYCGAAATNCPPGSSIGSTSLGGIPMFKYNRAMLEYDF